METADERGGRPRFCPPVETGSSSCAEQNEDNRNEPVTIVLSELSSPKSPRKTWGGGETDAADDFNDEPVEPLSIFLVPHVHSRFCERQDRICSAPGRFREHEKLEAKVNTEMASHPGFSFEIIIWESAHVSKPETYSTVVGRSGRELVMDLGVINCFVRCRVTTAGGKETVSASVGPVEAAPPQAFDLSIHGTAVEGDSIEAVYTYRGGREGNTEIWWLRIRPDGKRENATEPRPISGKDNPKFFRLGREDRNCSFKFKIDGRSLRFDRI